MTGQTMQRIFGVANLVVEGNAINDKTPAGVLVQGVNEGSSYKKYDELETDAEDAFVLALFNRR